MAWNGFVRAKTTLACIQLSKILGDRASREDVPCCAFAQNGSRLGFCETEPIPGSGPLYEALTSGISVAAVEIAGVDGFLVCL